MRVARRRSPAQSIIEFAIVLPVFLLLLFALIDFSRLLFTYVSLVNGTREVARFAALSVSGATNTQPITAFNQLTLVAGPANDPSDSPANSVTLTWMSETCAKNGGAFCTNPYPDAPVTKTCSLPLSTATCSGWPDRTRYWDGYVDVTTRYTFHFTPLFQATLGRISFMRSIATLTTTVRETIE